MKRISRWLLYAISVAFIVGYLLAIILFMLYAGL